MKTPVLLILLASGVGLWLSTDLLFSNPNLEPDSQNQLGQVFSEVFAQEVLTLKPNGREVGKSLQKHFRARQQEVYTEFLQEFREDSFALDAPYQTKTKQLHYLEVESRFFANGEIMSIFRLRNGSGRTVQLLHFAEIIEGVDDRVANRGYVIFDFDAQAYYFAKGSRPYTSALQVTVRGRGTNRTAFRIPAAKLRTNQTWFTFAPPAGGVKEVNYKVIL